MPFRVFRALPGLPPPPPSLAGIFVELTAWDAVFEDHHAAI